VGSGDERSKLLEEPFELLKVGFCPLEASECRIDRAVWVHALQVYSTELADGRVARQNSTTDQVSLDEIERIAI
jgi:hypothetical protein